MRAATGVDARYAFRATRCSASLVQKSKSRSTALREELPTNRDGIAPLLKTNKGDVGRELIRELGFSYAGWAPLEDGGSAAFAATIGSYSTVVGNHFVLTFDTHAEPGGLLDILRAAVEAFGPDEGRISVMGGAGGPTNLDLYGYKKNRGIAKL
jgi:hypothetical protein